MLSERSSVDIHALKRQGMTISEIARRTGHDRKTIRSYLNGDRVPGGSPYPRRAPRAASFRTSTAGTPASSASATVTTPLRDAAISHRSWR